jgi:hypothetical protein
MCKIETLEPHLVLKRSAAPGCAAPAEEIASPSCRICDIDEEKENKKLVFLISKNTSIEELEERPTANWIRRQLQHFAQARRDVCCLFSHFFYMIHFRSFSFRRMN